MVALCPPIVRRWQVRLEQTPLGHRLVRGAFWSLTGSLISRGLGMLAGIVVARILGKHAYGQLGMVQSTAGLFGVFAGFGMGLTANKHVAEFRASDPARAGRIIGLSSLVSWATGGLMTIALFILAPWLARTTLAAPEMSGLLRAGSLLLLFGGVNGAQTGALAGFEAFKTIARVNLIAGLSAFPITLAGAWLWGVAGSVWALAANLGLNCLLNFIALRQEAARCGVPVGYLHSGREWRVLWHFSLPSVLAGALSGPAVWAANALLVNQPDGYSQMGIFNAVYRIKIVPEMIVNMLLAPLLPVLAERFAARDINGFQKAAHSAFVLALLVTAPIALIQIACPALTLLPYGSAYAGHPAVVQWLMFELAVLGIFSPFSQMVASMNRMWFGLACNVGWAVLYFSWSRFLVPRYGAAGLAASPILAHLILVGPCLYYMYHKERAFLTRMSMPVMVVLLCSAGGLAFACQRWLPPVAAVGAVALLILFAAVVQRSVLRGSQPGAQNTESRVDSNAPSLTVSSIP